MYKKYVFFIIPCFFLAVVALAQEVTFPKDMVVIETDQGDLSFEMEIAADAEQRKHGLMYRRQLPNDSGMLFDYGFPQPATMWMKNTLIPLDMIFIRANGTIAYIHHRAMPGDLTPVSAGEPVRAVIELAGGQAKAHKIKVGDRVRYKIFSNHP